MGLSPRLRGNRYYVPYRANWQRSIPAPAGEPPSGRHHRDGGRRSIPAPAGEPWVRTHTVWLRSIPAPAGEPTGPAGYITQCAVYPRACGGTRYREARHIQQSTVYPRACGGTPARIQASRYVTGLSPRLRGNHLGVAHDGFMLHGLSPRLRGNLGRAGRRRWTGSGLSPRLRGNQRRAAQTAAVPGSIPAPAGEPIATHPTSAIHRAVYPRACGGTEVRYRQRAYSVSGLSPRLRGNLATTRLGTPETGSIPAPAGEPRSNGKLAEAWYKVYPRACGGTCYLRFGRVPFVVGLSPRLRGNRWRSARTNRDHRSIPAPAGEPHQ